MSGSSSVKGSSKRVQSCTGNVLWQVRSARVLVYLQRRLLQLNLNSSLKSLCYSWSSLKPQSKTFRGIRAFSSSACECQLKWSVVIGLQRPSDL